MTTKIIAIYCICDDVLIGLQHKEDKQNKITDAEVMTTAIVAVIFFQSNFEKARSFLKQFNFIPNMLSKSRFCRRLHKIKECFMSVFFAMSDIWKSLNSESLYLVDSFPILACDNYRIPKCKIYNKEEYRGYIPSKKRKSGFLHRISIKFVNDCL